MIRTDFTALFCILVPLPLILGAPVDDVLKQQQQQIASGAYREEPYWAYYNQDDDLPAGTFIVKTRGGIDSLGHGNILRSLGMGNEWGDKAGSSWRFVGGSPKRGGGLDSLGRGNILRRVNYDDEISNFIHSGFPLEGRNAFLRSLDSLGKGNILKRSVREISSSQQQLRNVLRSMSHVDPKLTVKACHPLLVHSSGKRNVYCMSLDENFSSLDKETPHELHDDDPGESTSIPSGGLGLANKKMDSLAGDVFGLAKRFDSISGATFGTQKRNFDEIDRNGFGAFVKRFGNGYYGHYNKRNFDEIDRTGFGAFVKRSA